MDIRLDGYVQLAGGWLATKVAMTVDGAPLQTEEYSEWKANVELAPALFDPADVDDRATLGGRPRQEALARYSARKPQWDRFASRATPGTSVAVVPVAARITTADAA